MVRQTPAAAPKLADASPAECPWNPWHPEPLLFLATSVPSGIDTPQSLESIPNASPGPAPSRPTGRAPTSSTTGIKTGSIYETYRPESRSARSRADNLAHTLVSTPVPAPRSAQDLSKPAASAAQDDGDSILDHLPPLDLPSDVADKSLTPPVPPAAQRKPQPQTSATASDHVGARSPREPELRLTGTTGTSPAAGEPASSPLRRQRRTAPGPGATPGIARFAAVNLKLAGGSVPSTTGLDWLADKGYKTLVNLASLPRPTSSSSPRPPSGGSVTWRCR